jgi:hypothetical protein
LVGAQIGVRLQELLDQIAVGAVDFDAIEPGLQRVLRPLPVGVDDAGDVAGFERARRLVEHDLPVSGRRLECIRNRHCRRRDRQQAARLK